MSDFNAEILWSGDIGGPVRVIIRSWKDTCGNPFCAALHPVREIYVERLEEDGLGDDTWNRVLADKHLLAGLALEIIVRIMHDAGELPDWFPMLGEAIEVDDDDEPDLGIN